VVAPTPSGIQKRQTKKKKKGASSSL